MTDRYLFDRSGEPDPEIERLERLLRPFRYERRGAPAMTRVHPSDASPLPRNFLAKAADGGAG